MGQSAEKTKSTPSTLADGEAKSGSPSAVTVLRCDHYLGRCWLLASSRESFSPSRWVPLSDRTLRGARADDKRAFAISTKALSGAQRKKIPFLTRNKITITEGLDVTPFDTVAVASYTREELKGRHSVLLGGQQIEIPADLPTSFPVMLVLSVKRAEVEMLVAQHEVRHYKRFPLRAPAANEQGRQEVGEGCITGVAFGGYLVVGGAQSCAEYAHKQLVSMLDGAQVKVENRKDSSIIKLDLSEMCTAENFRVLSCGFADCAIEQYMSSSFDSVPLEKALGVLFQYVRSVYTDPRKWVITNLFMQRYEALGAYILPAH